MWHYAYPTLQFQEPWVQEEADKKTEGWRKVKLKIILDAYIYV